MALDERKVHCFVFSGVFLLGPRLLVGYAHRAAAARDTWAYPHGGNHVSTSRLSGVVARQNCLTS
jgi:hypothetical protein